MNEPEQLVLPRVDLNSVVMEKGKMVTQVVNFIHGTKATFPHVNSGSIKQGQFTHFETADGRLILINEKNVLYVEVIKER